MWRRTIQPALVPVLAVFTAFLVGSVFLFITDIENLKHFPGDPLGTVVAGLANIGKAYSAMVVGAFGVPSKLAAAFSSSNPKVIAGAIRPITETLVASAPLIFTGLAVAISFRSGVFNIGVEGQFIMGAMGATVAVLAFRDVPKPLLLMLAVAIGTLTGALWGFIPGFLKARTGAHEVITTIMLNYVAAQPTRGLDVGSIEYIHTRLVEQRDAGAAILIVSTELDEVLAVADRIAVMFDGRIAGILAGAGATREAVGMLMGGGV